MPTYENRRQAIACLSILSFLLVSGTLSTSSMAEEVRRPSAESGLELAQKFCKACHIVAADGSQTAPVGPPSFPSIANKRGQTADRIVGALVAPHPPMPDMHLTNDEMQDIIAYLDTLRTLEGAPPPFATCRGEEAQMAQSYLIITEVLRSNESGDRFRS
jgi:cytochrome c2